MKKLIKILSYHIFITLLFFNSSVVFSQTLLKNIFDQAKPKSYICYKTNEKINIDGKINELSWEKAKWTDSFIDIEGNIKPNPRYDTKVKMLWDDNYLYISAYLEEPDIWAYLKERDTIIFYDNDFEVFLDPDGDTHQYLEFEMNALNTIWDLLLIKPYRDGGSAINNWDYKNIKTAVYIDGTINNPGDKDKGWSLEIALPMKDIADGTGIAVPPKNGDQWRINFSRVEWKTESKDGLYKKLINPKTNKPFPEDNWVWSPQCAINMHMPEMWGFLQFSDKIVGTSEEKFIYNIDEDAKWALRQVYYEEMRFFEKNKKFCSSIEKLGLSNIKIKGFKINPIIKCTENTFEVKITNEKEKYSFYIFQDGRIIKK